MTKPFTKLQVGVVGLGRISNNHLRAISNLPDTFVLSAVCDTQSSCLNNVSVSKETQKFTSLEDLLKNSNIDIVSLCTPSGLHAEQAITAIENGVNVITEKPMATNLRDGFQMVAAAQQHKKKLFVVKQNRFNPSVLELKRAIEAKRFGKIHYVNVNVFWTRPQEYYDLADWRGTWEFDGGALMNQASHYVDLMDWLIGPVEKVSTLMSTTRNIEVEDTASVSLKWRNGALGGLNVTMLTYPQNLEGSILVIGENGTAKVGGMALNKIELWDFSHPLENDTNLINFSSDIKNEYGNGHQKFYEHAAKSIIDPSSDFIDGKEGLKSLELLSAMYKSAREGRVVPLPLKL